MTEQHRKSATAENDAPRGPWIPVSQGFLCDPEWAAGQVVIRDQVAYWASALGGEYAIDLTDEAVKEAARRNQAPRITRPIPPTKSQETR